MVDVTVIVPVFNRQSMVIEALNSIAAQTCLPRNVVVVDDGSTDASVEAVTRWIAEHGARQEGNSQWRVRLFAQPKKTAAAARQFGMAHCDATEFVAFLDSDDLWPRDFLERAVTAMSCDRNIIASSADRRFVDATGTVFQRDDCRPLARKPVRWLFRHGAGVASCTLFRRAGVDAAGGWNERLDLCEDTALFSMVATLGRWRHLPGTAVTFRRSRGEARAEEGNLSQKHSDRFQRWAGSHEKVYASLRGRCRESERRGLRRYIAGYWYRAGKQWMANWDHAAARVCFDNAVLWWPLMLRPRLRRCRLPAVNDAARDVP
jgi:glycosyltransferase involved in cell wall biosynthesis